MNQTFHLKIISRDGVVFDGEVTSLTSFNKEGRFDILSLHANFISLIYKEILIVTKAGEKKELKIERALLKNKGNTAEIYLGIESVSG